MAARAIGRDAQRLPDHEDGISAPLASVDQVLNADGGFSTTWRPGQTKVLAVAADD